MSKAKNNIFSNIDLSKFCDDEPTINNIFSNDYIGIIQNISYGLKYTKCKKKLLDLIVDENDFFINLFSVIQQGYLGIKRQLKNEQTQIEKIINYIKESVKNEEIIPFYCILEIIIKNKRITIDSCSLSEIYYWFENNNNIKEYIGGILMLPDPKHNLFNSKELNIIFKKIQNKQQLDNENKKQILFKFIHPFRYDQLIETQIMFLSSIKKILNIYRGNIWKLISKKDRILDESWLIVDQDIINQKIEIFEECNINNMIEKYL